MRCEWQEPSLLVQTYIQRCFVPSQASDDLIRLRARPAPWQELHHVSGLPWPTIKWLAALISPGTKTGCPVFLKRGDSSSDPVQRLVLPLFDERIAFSYAIDRVGFKFCDVVADIVDQSHSSGEILSMALKACALHGECAGGC